MEPNFWELPLAHEAGLAGCTCCAKCSHHPADFLWVTCRLQTNSQLGSKEQTPARMTEKAIRQPWQEVPSAPELQGHNTATPGHLLSWFKQTRAALYQKSLLFVSSFSRKALHRPGNRTATQSYLLEVRTAFRANFHPDPSALQWTRNSFAVAAGWIGLSNGQQY